jgi:hypothetical protein
MDGPIRCFWLTKEREEHVKTRGMLLVVCSETINIFHFVRLTYSPFYNIFISYFDKI